MARLLSLTSPEKGQEILRAEFEELVQEVSEPLDRSLKEQHEQLKMLVSNNLFWTVPNVTTLATFSHAVHLLFYLSSVHQHDLTTATVCSDSSALDYRQC